MKFLDEADLLADNIAILTAPGKLVAKGTPVSLKRDLGEGYLVQVSFTSAAEVGRDIELLSKIRTIAPQTNMSSASPHQTSYHLRTKDTTVVGDVLRMLEKETPTYNVASYDVIGTTIEDIFLDLTSRNEGEEDDEKGSRVTVPLPEEIAPTVLNLSNGRPMSPLRQALTIFYKRWLIARRSWLTPVLTILVAIAGSAIPLVFLRGLKPQSCSKRLGETTTIPLYLPVSPITPLGSAISSRVLVSPPGASSILGRSASFLRTINVTDNAAFMDRVEQNYRNISLGGVSIDVNDGPSLFAWEATPPGIVGPAMLNLATNILFNRALNSSGNAGNSPMIIQANYAAFPFVGVGSLKTLKWMAFFGAVMVTSSS